MVHKSYDILSGLQRSHFDGYIEILKDRSEAESIWNGKTIYILKQNPLHMLNHESWKVNSYFSINQLHQSKVKKIFHNPMFLARKKQFVNNIKEKQIKWGHFTLKTPMMSDKIMFYRQILRYIRGRCQIIKRRSYDLNIMTPSHYRNMQDPSKVSNIDIE